MSAAGLWVPPEAAAPQVQRAEFAVKVAGFGGGQTTVAHGPAANEAVRTAA